MSMSLFFTLKRFQIKKRLLSLDYKFCMWSYMNPPSTFTQGTSRFELRPVKYSKLNINLYKYINVLSCFTILFGSNISKLRKSICLYQQRRDLNEMNWFLAKPTTEVQFKSTAVLWHHFVAAAQQIRCFYSTAMGKREKDLLL